VRVTRKTVKPELLVLVFAEKSLSLGGVGGYINAEMKGLSARNSCLYDASFAVSWL
jgi:hypothetical protein